METVANRILLGSGSSSTVLEHFGGEPTGANSGTLCQRDSREEAIPKLNFASLPWQADLHQPKVRTGSPENSF